MDRRAEGLDATQLVRGGDRARRAIGHLDATRGVLRHRARPVRRTSHMRGSRNGQHLDEHGHSTRRLDRHELGA